MTDQELFTEVDEATRKLLHAASVFNDRNFNVVPFAGSWTAGQVAEHVFKSESGVPDILLGNTSRARRDPQEHIPQLRAVFLDFATKMKSPRFILPSDEPKDRKKMIGDLEATKEWISRVVREIDLTRVCEDFLFPGVGALTGLELISFTNYHSLRHAHQLNNIHESFLSRSSSKP